MAADGVIRILITGDAKDLTRAVDDAGKGITGFAKKGLLAIGGLAVVDQIGGALIDIGSEALKQADRLGDATANLRRQVGPAADDLERIAGSMAKLGLSRQDAQELMAAFAEGVAPLQVGAPLVADMADDFARIAGAFALTHDTDPAQVIDLITKAAGGAVKPLRELGISLSDAEVQERALHDSGKDNPKLLTDTELAAARLHLIMEKLAPVLADVAGKEQDVEGKTKEIQARMETLSGDIGRHLEGPWLQVLNWLDDLFYGFGFVGVAIEGVVKWLGEIGDALGPLARLVDLLGQATALIPGIGNLQAGRIAGEGRGAGSGTRGPVTVNVNGGNPAEVERAVTNALNDANIRNGFRPFNY